MFEGFVTEHIEVGDTSLLVRHGGKGPPILLLHGHPRTSATWHKVAPLLVGAGFSVVCPDLRGYGRSGKPPTTSDHAPYSKRAMAGDMTVLMTRLGYERYAVAGHDRGSYVALRLALDNPAAVSQLAVLDSVPISEALARCDVRFAALWWHWFFFAQPETPERVICADPDNWYNADPRSMGEDNYAEFCAAIHDPATVHAMIEDYRAGLGIDRDHEEADKANGRRIECPVLVLWSSRDDMEYLYGNPLAIWNDWSDDVRGHSIESGHHMAEEAPEDLAAALKGFIRTA